MTDSNGSSTRLSETTTRRSHGGLRAAALVTGLCLVAVGGAALTRDVFDWRIATPDSQPPSGNSGPVDGPTLPARRTPLPTGPTPEPTGDLPPTYLDTLPVEEGEVNLVPLPEGLWGDPGYDRSIVIACPSNVGVDIQREVTYRLRRRYVEFAATVRPYHPGTPVEDKTYVYAIVGVRDDDGSMDRLARGSQYEARTDAPRELTASVADADELTLRVQCSSPGGAVVLSGAGMTRV